MSKKLPAYFDKPILRHIVIIEVWSIDGNERKITSEQMIAATDPIQAIRRAGMKLVQKLRKEKP